MQINIFRAFAVYAAATRLLEICKAAMSDKRLSNAEMQQIVTVGVLPILQALGEQVPNDLFAAVAQAGTVTQPPQADRYEGMVRK